MHIVSSINFKYATYTNPRYTYVITIVFTDSFFVNFTCKWSNVYTYINVVMACIIQ